MVTSSVRHIVSVTRTYYREHGLSATVSRALAKAARVALRREPVIPLPLQADAHGVPFRWDLLRAIGPLDASVVLVQELVTDLDRLDRIEVLLATVSRTTASRNEALLLDASGKIICRETFDSRGVRSNEFYPVLRPGWEGKGRPDRLFLVLRCLDASGRNAISAWRVPGGMGRLVLLRDAVPGDPSELARAVASSIQAPHAGSLVYRLIGYRALTAARYRRAELPKDHDQRTPQARTLVVGGGGRPLAKAAAAINAETPDVLVFDAVPVGEELRALLRTADQRCIPTVFRVGNPEDIARKPVRLSAQQHAQKGFNARDDVAFGLLQTARACNFVACSGSGARTVLAALRIRTLDDGPGLAPAAMAAYQRLRLPRVSVVTILYNKASELPDVLASYERQSYAGPIELVFVDDRSPDDSVRVVESWNENRGSHSGVRTLDVVIVRNDVNSGNCVSRNRGIAHATGDLVVVVDADCLLPKDFVTRHVEAHAFDDCEVVIGPMNIETLGRDPAETLAEYERDVDLAMVNANLQDSTYRASFLNCITRNFSIKREAIVEDLFDPLFTYSADPASGFGWEDVEMGYRLYARGTRIKFVEEAFTIHVSPAGVESDGSKPARSMRNFRRLFEKHPEFALVSRRWAAETLDRISGWAAQAGQDVAADDAFVRARIAAHGPVAPALRLGRRRRVLTYRWHVPHQYELYKLPFDFTLVTGLGSPMTETWDFGQRPMPHNARFARAEDVDPSEFDFAILHFDENVLAYENTNGVIGPDWGAAFRWFRDNVRIPSFAVCHGTPQFHGQYRFDYREPDLMQVIEPERQRLVDHLRNVMVVCNSHQAQREWGFARSRVIWHGFDPAEFPPASYERGIVSPLGPLVMSRPHYRGYFLYREVFDGYFDELKPETLRVPEPHVGYGSTGNAYAWAKYRNYIDELRRYSVYFNPTLRSPMPRARTEPMMCGVVTVSARNHDVDMFIENGVNGFYGDTAEELRAQLRYLVRTPDVARAMGARARETAMRVFNIERFLGEWARLVRDVAA